MIITHQLIANSTLARLMRVILHWKPATDWNLFGEFQKLLRHSPSTWYIIPLSTSKLLNDIKCYYPILIFAWTAWFFASLSSAEDAGTRQSVSPGISRTCSGATRSWFPSSMKIWRKQKIWSSRTRILGEHLEIMGWSRRWSEIIKLLFKESFSRAVHKTRSFSTLCVSDSLTYVYTNTYIHACRCCFSSQDYLLANFVEGTSL